MKNLILWVLGALLYLGSVCKSPAQTDEIQQLLLNVEKLDQLREMLDNMKDKYQILSQGYNQVKGIAEGSFQLHEAFLNRLLRVNPRVRNYHKVAEIVQLQLALIRGMTKAKQELRRRDFLQEQELIQVEQLYGAWSKSSLHLLEELMLVLSDNQLQMNDWERIQAIDRVHEAVLELNKGAARFSGSLGQLGDMRTLKSQEIQSLQLLFGNEK